MIELGRAIVDCATLWLGKRSALKLTEHNLANNLGYVYHKLRNRHDNGWNNYKLFLIDLTLLLEAHLKQSLINFEVDKGTSLFNSFLNMFDNI